MLGAGALLITRCQETACATAATSPDFGGVRQLIGGDAQRRFDRFGSQADLSRASRRDRLGPLADSFAMQN